MFGKIINGNLEPMATSGINENGCLYVVDENNAFEFATKNGYKEIILSDYPSEEFSYKVSYIETDTKIIQQWEIE